MHFEAGKKRLLLSLCVIQVVIIIAVYKTFTPGFHIQRAFIQTWNGLDIRSNLRRTLFGSTLRLNVTNPPAFNTIIYNKLAKVANQSVHFDITPDLVSNPFLLMLVITTPKDFLRRHVIRTSWGGTHRQVKLNRSAIFEGEDYDLNKLMLVFVVARSNEDSLNTKLEREADRYGDILRVSLNETYRGIVDKVLWAYIWATKTVNPRFILKADHDVYISIRQLLPWLLTKSPSLLYTGYVHAGAPVIRQNDTPHYVSKEQLSRDTFPNYCAGPCYVMSRQFVTKAISASNVITLFRVEDAYMGVVAEHLGVTPQPANEFLWNRGVEGHLRTWSDTKLFKYICIGDSLKTESIEYLHFRYMNLD